MAPTMPARCFNCGLNLDGHSGISIDNAIDVTLRNVDIICPRCGGKARLIEGRMNVVDGAIQMVSGPQWSYDLVAQLRLVLKQVIDETPADPLAPLEQVAPDLARDVRRVSEKHHWSTREIIEFLGAILGLLAYFGATPEVFGEAAVKTGDAVAGVVNQIAHLVSEAEQHGYRG